MLTEFLPSVESCTAVITSHTESGKNFDGAIVIGVYPGSTDEIWIKSKGTRTNIQLTDIDVLCRQLKRAKELAKEQK